MYVGEFINVLETIMSGSISAIDFIFTPIDPVLFPITPIYLISFGGLIAFLAIAVVKWFIS